MTSFKVQELFRDDAPRLGIPPDRVICTGDVVAYCGDPLATVNEIRDWGCHVLAGNCEKQLAAGALDCGCGFEEGTTCDLLSVAWYAFASAQLDAEARAWMQDLPNALAFGHAGRACLALHGGVTDVARFLFEASPEAEFAEELAALPAQPDWVLAGHCGIPFQRQIGDVAWINAGVIGMPPHDGGRATRFALLEGRRVLQHALGYDWRTAQDSMVAAGLAQGYHLALETGVWPSEDVLPQAMLSEKFIEWNLQFPWMEFTSRGPAGGVPAPAS